MPRFVVRLTPLLVGAALLAVFALPARATFIPTFEIWELWAKADCVIEATVDSTTAGWDYTKDVLVTHVYLNVATVHQGACLVGPRLLTQMGGVNDTLGLLIPLQPTFGRGEHVMLFLYEQPGTLFPVVGLDQGKFTIGPSPQSGEERFVNRLHRGIARSEMLGRLRYERTKR